MSKNIREININQIKIHDPFWSAMQHRHSVSGESIK